MPNETLPTFCEHRNRCFHRASPIGVSAVALGLLLGLSSPAAAGPKYPGDFTADAKLDALAKKVGAKPVAIEGAGALSKTVAKLKTKARVRVLQLGDSHIAADYITGMIRARLQKKYGDGGRGFVHIDQLWGFGGRRTQRKEATWTKTRVVDRGGPGNPFGFGGISLVSKKKGAKVGYRVLPGDELVRIYYQQRPGGPKVTVRLQKQEIGSFETAGPAKSKVFELALPLPDGDPPKKKRGPPGWALTLVAEGEGAQLFGIAFEKKAGGVIYESVGPVGADAKLYLETGRDSFVQHLEAHAPDLVVLMVGGNDALKSRKRWTNLEKVRVDHEQLVDLLKETLPDAEILMWGPMDAGDKKGGKVVSKALLAEVRDLQRSVAKAKGIAFWDTLEAMGGEGAITRWHKAKVMNKDLVHPKKRAADLLGRLAAKALLDL